MYIRIKDIKFRSKSPITGLKKPSIEVQVWRENFRHNYVYKVQILASPVTENKRLTLAVFSEVATAKEFLYAIEKTVKAMAEEVFTNSKDAKAFKAEVLKLRSTLMLTNIVKNKQKQLEKVEQKKIA